MIILTLHFTENNKKKTKYYLGTKYDRYHGRLTSKDASIIWILELMNIIIYRILNKKFIKKTWVSLNVKEHTTLAQLKY